MLSREGVRIIITPIHSFERSDVFVWDVVRTCLWDVRILSSLLVCSTHTALGPLYSIDFYRHPYSGRLRISCTRRVRYLLPAINLVVCGLVWTWDQFNLTISPLWDTTGAVPRNTGNRNTRNKGDTSQEDRSKRTNSYTLGALYEAIHATLCFLANN
jgi:hypothetical protein